jgi:hypothetical protein
LELDVVDGTAVVPGLAMQSSQGTVIEGMGAKQLEIKWVGGSSVAFDDGWGQF